MGRARTCHFAKLAQQLNILRQMAEVVVGNQATIGLAAELTELRLVHTFLKSGL